MNHQFFETLLLSDSELTQVESTMLNEHLQTCEACRQLSEAVGEVDNLFHNAAVVSPANGFTERFQVNLARDTRRRQRTQTILLFSLGLGSIGALFLLLGFTILPVFISPITILWAELFNLVSWLSSVETIVNIVSTLFRAAYTVVPPSLWIALAFAFMGLCVVWIVAFKQVTAPRRLVI